MVPGAENQDGQDDASLAVDPSERPSHVSFEGRAKSAERRKRGDSVSTRSSTNSQIRKTNASRPRLWTTDIGQAYLPNMEQESDNQSGYLSPHQTDRVFPVRSVVSVDATQTPFTVPRRGSGEQDGFPGFTTGGGDETASRQSLNRTESIASEYDTDGDSRTRHKQSDIPSWNSNVSARGSSTARSSIDGRSKRANSTSTHGDNYHGVGMQICTDSTSENSGETSKTEKVTGMAGGGSLRGSPADDSSSIGGLVTARFKHVVTEGGHAVITGRDGETLQRCEDEPIHIPGAVQSFGLLVALREEGEEGNLVIRIVSENSMRIIGYTPQELFALESFTDILSEEQTDNLLDHIDFIRDEEADPATNGPEVFTLTVKSGQRRTASLWCAMHINPAAPDTIICEFELEDDQMYPLAPQNEETPDSPEDTLHSHPTDEEYEESTKNSSKPLRVLRSARKRRGEAAAMEVFNIMSQVQEQLASAPNLDQFLKVLVGVVKELTGFHRVMIYQFDTSFNGRVVTELVDPRATKDLYKGLNFPASDIPKQARELYKINKVRLLYDRENETARLVCKTIKDLEEPLDLSFSYLRAMSPIHIKYLANMAVRSSMSISMNAFDELWGLIACHAYGSKGMRVSFPIRKMCRLVGDSASRNIERLSYASRLQARKLINTLPTEANPSGYIIASSDDLLTLFDADFGLLSIKGETKILGRIDQSQEALAMLEYLRLRRISSVVTSQDIRADFPDLRYQPGFTVIAGLLLVPLSVNGNDFIVFFRKGQVREVKWAGNPYEKFIKEGTEGYLEPRRSFKTWSETVVGKCRDWTEEQIETAAVLCLVYGKFIEVWRQKEAALQSSQLTRLLLANSAHEVRTPLNAIINYLEIALEGVLDQETRDNLAKSHSASKSLIYVINDLLDLTKMEEGQSLIKDEVFDLPATVREATEVFRGDAKRKGIEYDIIQHPGVPQFVQGDQRRVRQAVSNVTANAMQNTTTGWVTVELYLAHREDHRVAVDIVIEDSGSGMSDQKLDALFRDLEQVTTDEDTLLSDTDSNKLRFGFSTGDDDKVKPSGRALGLGLALVARIVRNMEGQLRLKSEEGKGSRFVIQLPFDIPQDEGEEGEDEEDEDNGEGNPSISSVLAATPVTPPATEGEVLLVSRPSDSPSVTKSDHVMHRRSFEDMGSLQSFRTASSDGAKSSKSDVDRLIDAISGPLAVGQSEGLHPRRSNSKGSRSSINSINSRQSFNSIDSSTHPPSTSHGSFNRQATNRSRTEIPEHLRTSERGVAGTELIKDSKTLIKAVRMPDEHNETEAASPHASPRVLFDLRGKKGSKRTSAEPSTDQAQRLEVLVAEDDPVNSRIIQKRLEKIGHAVHLTVNGEECASSYGDTPSKFAVVLMDMQMPIVDGLTSTKMIRSFEKTHPQIAFSPRTTANGCRVPIFAVSASLVERERQTYINAGFDGWILKPIDFKRLNTLLAGIDDEKIRNGCLYQQGHWERGGWFSKIQSSVFRAATAPSQGSAVTDPPPAADEADQFEPPMESPGSETTITEEKSKRPLIYDERLVDLPRVDSPCETVLEAPEPVEAPSEDTTKIEADAPKSADAPAETAEEAEEAEEVEEVEEAEEVKEEREVKEEGEADVEVILQEGEEPRSEKEEDAMLARRVDSDREIEDVTDQPDE